MNVDHVKREPGVFALLHPTTAEAYVNETKDLRQRALLWLQRLNSFGKIGEGEPSEGDLGMAKAFPKYPVEEWTFWVSSLNYADTRASLAQQNWKLLNDYRPRMTHTIVHRDGKPYTGSLASHCVRAGAKLHTVYKRIDRGLSVAEALGVTDLPPPDKRELAISQMRVQIQTDDGAGLLTYDEAVMLRPEIGDIREKLKRWRKKHPDVTTVKLAEIPA